MQLTVMCSQCGASNRVAQALAGRPTRCEKCAAELIVPRVETPDDDGEITEHGDRIYRHGARDAAFELAIGDSEAIHAISAHIERHVGKVDGVLHEIIWV